MFNGLSTFVGYLMPKPSFQKDSNNAILTRSWEDKGVHTFPKGICLKVNVIARLEFELAYNDSALQCFNHYTTRTPPIFFFSKNEKLQYSKNYNTAKTVSNYEKLRSFSAISTIK